MLQHVAKCHNFWNHFSMTMQELQVCFGLFNAKGVFHLHLFQSQLTFFGPYHTLQFLLRVIHSDLGGCLCTTSCTSWCATLSNTDMVWEGLTVWASCTLILCKKGALDYLPRGTATVGVGCSKGSNTDCFQASSNIFKPASYEFRIFDDIWWYLMMICAKAKPPYCFLDFPTISNRVPLHSVFCIVLPW